MGDTDEINEVPLCTDDILSRVGQFGRFQKLVDGIFCLSFLICSYQSLIMYFCTLTPSWKCKTNATMCIWNGTHLGNDRRRCEIPREEWYYTADKHYSLVTEFDLQCKKEWLLRLVASMNFIGVLFGAIVTAFVADKYGRKVLMFISYSTVLIIGFVSSFLPNIFLIIATRFVIGFFLPNLMTGSTILISEIVGNQSRPIAIIVPFFILPIGLCILALKAYLIQNWKFLSIACTAPYILALPLYRFIPESPKWLHMKGRYNEALEVFRKMAQWNNRSLDVYITISTSDNSINSNNPISSDRRANGNCKWLFFQVTIQCFIWFSISMCLNGFYFAANELRGNLYTNFVFLSLVAIPAVILSIFISKKVGRKLSNLIPLFLSGIACIGIALIPTTKDYVPFRIAIGVFGQFFTTVTAQGLYVWSNEIFPTHMRSKGMFGVVLVGRIGTIAGSYVIQGLAPYGAYIPFVVLGVPNVIASFIGWLLPETKKKLEDETSL